MPLFTPFGAQNASNMPPKSTKITPKATSALKNVISWNQCFYLIKSTMYKVWPTSKSPNISTKTTKCHIQNDTLKKTRFLLDFGWFLSPLADSLGDLRTTFSLKKLRVCRPPACLDAPLWISVFFYTSASPWDPLGRPRGAKTSKNDDPIEDHAFRP